jgi:hypothetical protein
MYIQTQTNQTQLIHGLIVNEFHFSFTILKSKLIPNHTITNKQIELITKLLNRNYLNSTFKIIK